MLCCICLPKVFFFPPTLTFLSSYENYFLSTVSLLLIFNIIKIAEKKNGGICYCFMFSFHFLLSVVQSQLYLKKGWDALEL